MIIKFFAATRKFIHICTVSIVAGAILTLVAPPALADSVRFDFEAIIVELYDPHGYSPPTWMEGDTIHGYYMYELGVVDATSDPEIGLYEWGSPPTGILINHKGYEYRTNPESNRVTLELTNSPSVDEYFFLSWNIVLEPLVLGVGGRMIGISLVDSTGTALSDTALPTTPPVLSAWGDYHHVKIWGDAGYWIVSELIGVSESPTGIGGVAEMNLELQQNVPNPFNPVTRVPFSLPRSSKIRMSIYDVSGRFVVDLARGVFERGPHVLEWNGTDEAGRQVASGVYICRLTSDEMSVSRKLVLIR